MVENKNSRDQRGGVRVIKREFEGGGKINRKKAWKEGRGLV